MFVHLFTRLTIQGVRNYHVDMNLVGSFLMERTRKGLGPLDTLKGDPFYLRVKQMLPSNSLLRKWVMYGEIFNDRSAKVLPDGIEQNSLRIFPFRTTVSLRVAKRNRASDEV